VNPTGIVPKGPVVDFAAPHDRDRLGGPGGLDAVAARAA
jgi:putative glutathione S-transferase